MTNEEIIEQLININIEICNLLRLASIGLLHSFQTEDLIKKLETLKDKKEEER